MFISEQYILIEEINYDQKYKSAVKLWDYWRDTYWERSRDHEKLVKDNLERLKKKLGLTNEDLEKMSRERESGQKEEKSNQNKQYTGSNEWSDRWSEERENWRRRRKEETWGTWGEKEKENRRRRYGEEEKVWEEEKKAWEERKRKAWEAREERQRKFDEEARKFKEKMDEDRKRFKKQMEDMHKKTKKDMTIAGWVVAVSTIIYFRVSDKMELVKKLKKRRKLDVNLTDKIKRIYPESEIKVKDIKGTDLGTKNQLVIAHKNLVGYIKSNTKKLTDNELIALLLAEYFYQNKIIKKMSTVTVNVLASAAILPLEFIYIEKYGGNSSRNVESMTTLQYFISLLFSMGGVKLEKEMEKIFKYKMKELKAIGYDKYYLSAMNKIGKSSLSLFKKKLEKKGHSEKDIEKLNKVILNKHPKEIISIIKKVKKNKK